jgi:hypothetical protein
VPFAFLIIWGHSPEYLDIFASFNNTQTHRHTDTQTHRHKHTHTHTHTHIHIHTHTHTYTHIPTRMDSLPSDVLSLRMYT